MWIALFDTIDLAVSSVIAFANFLHAETILKQNVTTLELGAKIFIVFAWFSARCCSSIENITWRNSPTYPKTKERRSMPLKFQVLQVKVLIIIILHHV